MLALSRCADFRNSRQRRVQYNDLDKAREGCGHHLRHEHGARRNLHVVAKLQIRHERQSLAHGDVAKGLEDHERQGPSGLDVTKNELSQDIETDLVVCNGLYDSDGQGKTKGNDHSQQESPPRQIGGES